MMSEHVQKSYKLINFNDSIFDQKHQATDDKNDLVDGMLKRSSILTKNISYDKLINLFLLSNTDDLDLEDEILRDLIVFYEPLVKGFSFETIINKAITMNSPIFGNVYFESKVLEIMDLKNNFFRKCFKTEEITVFKKEIEDQIALNIDDKTCYKLLAVKLSMMEAQIYCSMNMPDIYECDIAGQVALFNNLTKVFISQILKEDSADIRVKCVKNLLKLAKCLFKHGTMNTFASCILALQSSSVHRLNLFEGLKEKNKKIYFSFIDVMSPENNFKSLRERPCLIPWFGLLLRDFTFIQEVIFANYFKDGDIVNIPLGLCLRRLVLPILASREAAFLFLKEKQRNGQLAKSIAIIKKWLETGSGIIYENECEQFERSKMIK